MTSPKIPEHDGHSNMYSQNLEKFKDVSHEICVRPDTELLPVADKQADRQKDRQTGSDADKEQT